MRRASLRSGGSLALGITIGALGCLIALLSFDFFQLIPFEDSAFTGAIIGAVIAGGIGVLGQLLVIAKNELLLEDGRRISERTKLETMLSRVLRVISMFAQARQHVESEEPFDNVVFRGLSPLMKPLTINDLPDKFTPEDLALPLQLSDRNFFNLVNVLDSVLGNFRWTHEQYEARMGSFLESFQHTGQMEFSEGHLRGSGEIRLPDYHALKDLQDHYIDSVYPGLVVAKRLSDILVDHLKRRHSVDLSFSDRIPPHEWEELFAAVDTGNVEEDLAYED